MSLSQHRSKSTPFSCSYQNHLSCFVFVRVSVCLCVKNQKVPLEFYHSKIIAHWFWGKLVRCKLLSLNHNYVWFIRTNLFWRKNCFPLLKQSTSASSWDAIKTEFPQEMFWKLAREIKGNLFILWKLFAFKSIILIIIKRMKDKVNIKCWSKYAVYVSCLANSNILLWYLNSSSWFPHQICSLPDKIKRGASAVIYNKLNAITWSPIHKFI